ncbi:coproporphyrinogen III oxidase [Bacteroidia bacterium]|nr:coproporphyrinogen III oxidase [Bacteroidia bacterium]
MRTVAGIYIHIPFCKRKCNYCDFYSCTSLELAEPFLSALEREMELRREELPVGPIATLYIGGGTPSLLTPVQADRLIGAVGRHWDCSALRETTMEVNPDDVRGDYLEQIARLGVDRLSIGLQSLVDGDLQLLGRRHDTAKALAAVAAARRAGFDNLSVDLIYGIPGMSLARWGDNLRRVVDLDAPHISAYHLSVEEGTPLASMVRRGELTEVDEDQSGEQFDLLCRTLGEAGYEHYEISSFARPGFRAVHNSAYWSGEPYLGLGPSAHSYDGRRRSWNVASTEGYIEGGDIRQGEELGERERYNEYVMTALRRIEGVDMATLRRLFGPRQASYFERCATEQVQKGRLLRGGDNYRIDEPNMLVSNEIIASLFSI